MAAVEEVKSKGGRPKKETRGGLTKILGFRLRPDLRAKLETAAQSGCRSISEECEYRLNRSFEREAATVEMFGHDAHRALVLALGRAIRMVEPIADEPGDKLQAYAVVISTIEGLSGKRAAQIVSEAADGPAQDVAAAVVAVEQGTPFPRRLTLEEILPRG